MRKVRRMPPWLDQNSTGDAVNGLIDWFHEYFKPNEMPDSDIADDLADLEPNGCYGPLLVNAVKWLQGEIGFPEEEIDGNFGQGTRSRLREVGVIAGFVITHHPDDEEMPNGAVTHYYSPMSDGPLLWNNEEAKKIEAYVPEEG